MKLPETAPDWEKVLKSNFDNVLTIALSTEMAPLLQKANRNYLYWDKFRYLPMPEGISPEVAWSYLKLNRTAQFKKMLLENTKGNPFSYWLPDSILKQFHYIDQQAGGQILVDEPNVHAQERERYLINSIMEEAIASSQLEGAVTTRKVAKEMLRSGRKPKDRAEQMILNNYDTIRTMREVINKPLTPELICSLQESMTKNTLDDSSASGRFRKDHEEVHVIDQRDGNILHIPPAAGELPERLNLLCRFANEDQDDEFVHPVVKGIILHFWLAYDHPFVDGNGRTARALFYWHMLKNKYWLFEFLSVSRIILRAPAQYYRAFLYSELDGQDMTYFISFHLHAIHLAIVELRSYLKKKQRELGKTTQLLRDYPGLNHRQRTLLYHALTHPNSSYAIDAYKNTYGVVYQTARSDLLDLESRSFLEKRKSGKTFYFIPTENLDKKLRVRRESREL